MRISFPAIGIVTILLSMLLTQCVSTGPQKETEAHGVPVRFTYINGSATTACIAGSFNGWSRQSDCMLRNGSTWSIELLLSPGRHEYAFVVDGDLWQADPYALFSEESGFGRMNSILIVE